METMETTLAAATLSDVFGLVGTALATIVIALTLVGTKTLRSIIARLRPQPVVHFYI